MKIGVLGAGQLGRMLALAGTPLGLEFVFYNKNPDACAAQLGEFVVGEFEDRAQLARFAARVDVVTLEFENIPLSALEQLAQETPLFPAPAAVRVAQDRLNEKTLFTSLGIPTPQYYQIDSVEQLQAAAARHGETLIVKSRRLGYDGKGQATLRSPNEAAQVWQALGGVALIAEQRMAFTREVSLIAVRNTHKELRVYPLVENLHQHGILLRSTPRLNDPLQAQAEAHAHKLMSQLDYVGVLAFEFFDCDGQLVANEIAPRVHNSGHWTIEGAHTSQFENHLRAILGWPLGDTGLRTPCVMYNLIGEMPPHAALLKLPDAHLHDYGKAPRAGRKLGHITLCNPQVETTRQLEDMLF